VPKYWNWSIPLSLFYLSVVLIQSIFVLSSTRIRFWFVVLYERSLGATSWDFISRPCCVLVVCLHEPRGCTRHNRAKNRFHSAPRSGYTRMHTHFSGSLTFPVCPYDGRRFSAERARARASAYLLTHAGHASRSHTGPRVVLFDTYSSTRYVIHNFDNGCERKSRCLFFFSRTK